MASTKDGRDLAFVCVRLAMNVRRRAACEHIRRAVVNLFTAAAALARSPAGLETQLSMRYSAVAQGMLKLLKSVAMRLRAGGGADAARVVAAAAECLRALAGASSPPTSAASASPAPRPSSAC